MSNKSNTPDMKGIIYCDNGGSTIGLVLIVVFVISGLTILAPLTLAMWQGLWKCHLETNCGPIANVIVGWLACIGGSVITLSGILLLLAHFLRAKKMKFINNRVVLYFSLFPSFSFPKNMQFHTRKIRLLDSKDSEAVAFFRVPLLFVITERMDNFEELVDRFSIK